MRNFLGIARKSKGRRGEEREEQSKKVQGSEHLTSGAQEGLTGRARLASPEAGSGSLHRLSSASFGEIRRSVPKLNQKEDEWIYWRLQQELGEGKKESLNLRDLWLSLQNWIIWECQHIQSPTQGSHPIRVSHLNSRGCAALQPGILLRRAGITLGRGLAQDPPGGAMPALFLTANPYSTRSEGSLGFISAH